MARPRKVLLIASAGGHWVQLARLSPAFEAYDALYVTTMAGARAPSGARPVLQVSDASRSSPWRIAGLVLQMALVMARFRPDVVITTGAAPGLIGIHIGKVFGARTAWIDSMANSEQLSMSGKLAGRCADLWLTQWPHLTKHHPRLKSFGSVL